MFIHFLQLHLPKIRIFENGKTYKPFDASYLWKDIAGSWYFKFEFPSSWKIMKLKNDIGCAQMVHAGASEFALFFREKLENPTSSCSELFVTLKWISSYIPFSIQNIKREYWKHFAKSKLLDPFCISKVMLDLKLFLKNVNCEKSIFLLINKAALSDRIFFRQGP